MKYDLGYTVMQRINSFFGRNVLTFRKTELNYMLDLIRNEKGKKILDFGCNSGFFTDMIKKAAPENEVCGGDINDHALKWARKKHPHMKFYKINKEFYRKKKFDIIVVSHVLEHIRDRETFMKQLSKILTKNGRIIVTVPQERIRGDAAIVPILYNWIRFRFENPHVANLRYEELKELFSKTGFSVNKKTYTNYFYPLKSKSRKFYAWSLVVLITKT